jgi:hypothetical protein
MSFVLSLTLGANVLSAEHIISISIISSLITSIRGYVSICRMSDNIRRLYFPVSLKVEIQSFFEFVHSSVRRISLFRDGSL